jgi:hypothetical protein
MPQIFNRSANTVARVAISGVALGLAGLGCGTYAAWWSPYMTRVEIPLQQPVPFSHKHHAGGLGIDCRYCHTSVETSSFAGMPPSETCMTCHSQIWRDAPMLEPVRASLREDKPLRWNRVNDLPDFVYFDHSIHVKKGVGCAECHGRVDEMPLTWRSESLYMKWCLDCHRHPENVIRPTEEVLNMGWEHPSEQKERAAALLRQNPIDPEHMMDCSACHR